MISPGAPEDRESHSDEHSPVQHGEIMVVESDNAPWAAPRVHPERFRDSQDSSLSFLSLFFFFDFLADAKSLTALATAVANSSALLLLRADAGREPLEFDRVRATLEVRGRGSLPGRGDFLTLPGAARRLP